LHGKNVVIDRGLNISVAARRRFLGIANAADIVVNAVVFPKLEPHLHATKRFHNDNRGKSIQHWQKVAERHDRLWECPTVTEGFREIRKIEHE
jgi:hypothetical protein